MSACVREYVRVYMCVYKIEREREREREREEVFESMCVSYPSMNLSVSFERYTLGGKTAIKNFFPSH